LSVVSGCATTIPEAFQKPITVTHIPLSLDPSRDQVTLALAQCEADRDALEAHAEKVEEYVKKSNTKWW